MSESSWDPYRDPAYLQDRVGRLLRQEAGPLPEGGPPPERPWTPPVDILENADTIVLRVDVPGLGQDDVEVRVLDGALTIRGQRAASDESAPGMVIRAERPGGSFVRTFALPANIDPSATRATQRNGVLEVTLSKRKESKSKAIRIEVT